MPRPSSYRAEVLAQPQQTAIYAAARNYTVGKGRKGSSGRTKDKSFGDDWQDQAWDFYDIIGEFRYAVDWVGNLLSRATLYPVKDGAKSTDARAIEGMRLLFGGPEGQAEMLHMLGIHYTVAGEGFIFGIEDDEDDVWHVIAAREVKRVAGKGDESSVFKVKSMDIEVTDSEALVIRAWRAHPRKPNKANSPARSVLPILAEINKLTMHVAAQLDSRLAGAGLLLLPSEMSFPTTPTSNDDTGAQAPASSGAQDFVNMLIDVMSTAIGNRDDASALVPIVLQVAGEYLEKVQHLKFWSELDEKAIDLRNEAIRRLALGMDMPPEVLTGTGDMNHWNAWAVDEASIKSHSEPLLKAITNALTTGYLRPYLEAEGMSAEEAREFSIGADTAQLRMRPNRSKEAIELYEHGELKAETMRRENGFTEDDAPDDEERRNWLIRKVASGSATPEQVGDALRLLGIQIVSVDEGAEPREARPDPSTREHPTRTPPNDGEVPSELLAAAEQMVFRALERAGNRLKNRVGGKTGDVPAYQLYLRFPEFSAAEASALLDDAWTCTEWQELPLAPTVLAAALDGYTSMLLTMRKSHDRDILRDHLSAALRPALVAV